MAATTTVEQRWSQRRPVSVPVEVRNNGQIVAQSISRDIGLGGVFLILDATALDSYQDLELFFELDVNDNVTRHKLKAKLVRSATDGGGFMFKDFDTNAFRALQEIIRYSGAH